jgi:hypothetical protein
VGAFRLKRVCRAAKEGAEEWLRTLPGLVVCGGGGEGDTRSAVCRLDLGELRWEHVSDLTLGRYDLACCAVRGRVVALGGIVDAEDEREEVEEGFSGWMGAWEIEVATVEILGYDSDDEVECFEAPLLSCGRVNSAAAVAIEESESELGQVLLIGGRSDDGQPTSAVHKVDLATGVCTPQPSLLSYNHHGRRQHLHGHSAARLPDGRVVCVGSDCINLVGSAQVLEPPEQGTSASGASWQWRYLPAMSLMRNDALCAS